MNLDKSLNGSLSCVSSTRRAGVEQERTDLRLFRLFTAHTTAFSPTHNVGWLVKYAPRGSFIQRKWTFSWK